MIRLLLPLLLSAAPQAVTPQPATPTVAQAALPATPGPPAPDPATMPKVAIETSKGRIVIALETQRAPITAANFLRYVDGKRLDGITFYRAVKVAEDFGFVQFGVQNAPKRVLPPIRHEPSTLTNVHHTDGAISIARFAPGTASGDFTINLGEAKSLDADPSQPGDNLGYAAFGHVVEGRDVVKAILDAPVSSSGAGALKGQMIADPVTVISARRVP